MQFTNRRGNGTYALVVRRCPSAKLDPKFESGATNLLNAMKAAACLLDLDLAGMREDIRFAYRANPEVLGIFPVAAYNGGSRNVGKLYRVLTRMKVKLDELNRPGVQLAGSSVTCPCIWKTDGTEAGTGRRLGDRLGLRRDHTPAGDERQEDHRHDERTDDRDRQDPPTATRPDRRVVGRAPGRVGGSVVHGDGVVHA